MKRTFWGVFIGLSILVAASVVGAYFFRKSFEGTPQYSLALLIDAARRDDQAAVDRLVNIDAMVEDFVPQVTAKAADIYGRGMPPSTIARMQTVAAPLMPAIKERARAELPRLIRKETERFAAVPFAGFVIGADRYLDIKVEGDMAVVASKLPRHQFEATMRRSGESWQVVAVRNDELANRIAQAIGRQIIAIATKKDLRRAGEELGIQNIQELIRQAEQALQ